MRGYLLAAYFAILLGTGPAQAADAVGARDKQYANPVYTQEGDNSGREWFNVSCSSFATTWTAVVAAEPLSRSVTMVAIAANTGGVVLSSATASLGADAATDTTQGVHLYPSASLTDYTSGSWSCRSRAGNTDRVTGYRSKHSADQ